MKFSVSYPVYKMLVCEPIFWRDLKFNLYDKELFNSHELETISKYLINGKEFNATNSNYKIPLEKFQRLTKITVDNPEYLLKNIGFLKNLTDLNIKYCNLNDYDLVLITNMFEYLRSLFVESNLEINNGLEFFLQKVKYLISFGFMLPKISEK